MNLRPKERQSRLKKVLKALIMVPGNDDRVLRSTEGIHLLPESLREQRRLPQRAVTRQIPRMNEHIAARYRPVLPPMGVTDCRNPHVHLLPPD